MFPSSRLFNCSDAAVNILIDGRGGTVSAARTTRTTEQKHHCNFFFIWEELDLVWWRKCFPVCPPDRELPFNGGQLQYGGQDHLDWDQDQVKTNTRQRRDGNFEGLRPRGRPHERKQSFFPPSSSASFQEYLRPYTEKHQKKRCSSYSRDIDGAWHSPKSEKKRRSMHSKLERCKQTDSRWRNQTQQEEDKNGECKETRRREGCVFRFFHPETHFQINVFSGALFTASVWMVGQNDAFSQKSILIWTAPTNYRQSPNWSEISTFQEKTPAEDKLNNTPFHCFNFQPTTFLFVWGRRKTDQDREKMQSSPRRDGDGLLAATNANKYLWQVPSQLPVCRKQLLQSKKHFTWSIVQKKNFPEVVFIQLNVHIQ